MHARALSRVSAFFIVSLLATLSNTSPLLAQDATPSPGGLAQPLGELQGTILQQLWQTIGSPAQPVGAGGSVILAPDGNIWLLDGMGNDFQIFTQNGEFVESWDGSERDVAGFKFAPDGENFEGDVAFGADGAIYTVEAGAYRVRVYDKGRHLLREWGSQGESDGEFQTPMGLALDAAGNIYVSDEKRNDVQVFGPDGTFLRKFGSYGNGDGQFQDAGYLAVTRDGKVLVTDQKNGRVNEFTTDGAFVRAIGQIGTFHNPQDVVADANGRVFITDTDASYLRVFDVEGNEIVAWEVGTTPNGKLNLPYSVAVDETGKVYISGVGLDHNSESNLQKFEVRPAS